MDNDPNLHGYRVIKTHEKDPVAQRLEAVERFGDAILRWVISITAMLVVAAVAAAYVVQCLEGR